MDWKIFFSVLLALVVFKIPAIVIWLTEVK